MSENSLPAPDDQHKPVVFIDAAAFRAETLIIQMLPCDVQAFGADIRMRLRGRGRLVSEGVAPAPQPTPKPVKAPKRRPQRKSGLYAMLHAAQQHGITHPKDGFWTMLPKEFDAILALEHKAVAQVVLEVLRQTIGAVGDGQDGRQEWATISYRQFARAGLMTSKAAQRGIQEALAKHYIVRRPVGARRYQYAIRWRGTN